MTPAHNLVKSDAVMAFFGYADRTSFWSFVHGSGVPHIRLSSHKIMFDPVALNSWIARHNTSAEPRQFEFGRDENQALPVAGS